MKKVLIISPYFLPSNTPDSQRIRMSLPYFVAYGWDPEIVCLNDKHSEFTKDERLWQSIPSSIKIHRVEAISKKITSKIGLGSVGIRSLPYYIKKVNSLLNQQHFDLIYFSTTQFPVCILGPYWKKKFKVPYLIDMQDPWHTEYYEDKPKSQRPPKYWFSFRLNKFLERITMKTVDGLLAVSQNYLDELMTRYPHLSEIPKEVITFGYSAIDLKIANINATPKPEEKNDLVYIGVLGPMMHRSLEMLFAALEDMPMITENFDIKFKGTSYSNSSTAVKTAEPIAAKHNLKSIQESTERISILEVLKELSQATALLIVGTDDPAYTASKLYPYLQVKKPILAILHQNSSANKILSETSNAIIIHLNDDPMVTKNKLENFFEMVNNKSYTVNTEALSKFSAESMTAHQCSLFNRILKK